MIEAGSLLLAAAALGAGAVIGPRLSRTWLALVLLGSAALITGALVAVWSPGGWQWTSPFLVGEGPLHFRVDALSAMFLVLVAVVGGAAAVYSRTYWSDGHYPVSAPRGRRWWCVLLLSLSWVLVASSGLQFLMGWELFTVSAYFLITLERKRREVRAAGWLYLAASHAGTLCLFAFFSALAARTGSWDLGPLKDHPELRSLFWLALVGFGVKAGLFGLHVWLPSAHANAPSHVSAILSGVAVKMGIYGIVRFSGWMPLPESAGWVMVGVGAVSAVCGIAFALVQNDVKRLLAYCTVENIGVISMGVGVAWLAREHHQEVWGQVALMGALLHVWNHGIFKTLLFFGAGSVLHSTGTREMSRLGGLWKVMPWTAVLFAVGAVAVSGLPPLNGFVSEWLIYLGLFDAVQTKSPAAWAAIPAVLALATAGALALATFLKVTSIVFLGAPRTKAARTAHESGGSLRAAMVVVATLCVLLGLIPAVLWPVLGRAVEAWEGGWGGAEPPAALGTLGAVHIGLAALLVVLILFMKEKLRINGQKTHLTWDCGYAAPTARMQYTSGSLGGLAGGWFGWLLQPQGKLRRPRGLMPLGALRVERIPETVLEKLITPVGTKVIELSTAVRQLQHGRLQFYILYLVAGLGALGMLVLLGEMV